MQQLNGVNGDLRKGTARACLVKGLVLFQVPSGWHLPHLQCFRAGSSFKHWERSFQLALSYQNCTEKYLRPFEKLTQPEVGSSGHKLAYSNETRWGMYVTWPLVFFLVHTRNFIVSKLKTDFNWNSWGGVLIWTQMEHPKGIKGELSNYPPPQQTWKSQYVG